MKRTSYYTDLTSSLILLVFLFAGIKKLASPERFKDVLSQAAFLRSYAEALSVILPVAELLVAILLFVYSTRLAGLYGATILLFLYSVYIGSMLLYAQQLPCSCGGITEQLSWEGHLLLNALLFLAGLTAIILFHRNVYRGKRAPPKLQ